MASVYLRMLLTFRGLLNVLILNYILIRTLQRVYWGFRADKPHTLSVFSVQESQSERMAVLMSSLFPLFPLIHAHFNSSPPLMFLLRQIPRIPQPQAWPAHQQFPKDVRVHPQGRLVKKHEPHEPGTRSPALRLRASGLRASGR